MNRRHVLASAGTLIAGLAGCLETTQGDAPSSTETPTEDTPAEDTPAEDTPDADESAESTETPSDSSGLAEAANQPNADHPVRVINHDDSAYSVSVKITQDGETIDTVTHESNPDANDVVYNLRQADPDGIEEYDVTATLGNQSETVKVRTNDCFGDVNVVIQSDGSLFVTYSIC